MPAERELSSQDIAIADDLSRSGLKLEDIQARVSTATEKAATKAPSGSFGYVIPYYDIYGRPTDFYRIRQLEGDQVKYRQVAGSANYIYFPLETTHMLKAHKRVDMNDDLVDVRKKCLIITEGEKKSARAAQEGFMTVGLGGVDNWRTRSLTLPGNADIRSKMTGKRKTLQVKLPSTVENLVDNWMFARGLETLIDLVVRQDLMIVILYDSDEDGTQKFEVQRAAAILGYGLRAAGVPSNRLRRLILPQVGKLDKVGLDDYLQHEGADDLEDLLVECLADKHAFPVHPNPRSYVSNMLNRGQLKRSEMQGISYAILTELDARGRRMTDISTNGPYFFDEKTLQLMQAHLMHKHGAPIHETSFGQFLYQNYGLSAADSKLLTWLASQMTGEPEVSKVDPRRNMATLKEGVAIQISDSQFILVHADPMTPFELCSNGSYGIMFEKDQVDPIDGKEVIKAAMDDLKQAREDGHLRPKWLEVMDDTNVKDQSAHSVASLLFYISPWFLRWRGIQLPVEVYVGEPGSGKSSLAALRLQILTGRPSLKNVPNDVRDWNASIVNGAALHVIDNVHFTNKDLRQRLSDEICRIITEPDPHVEMRKLYTTADSHRVPVRCTFAVTAIQPPFLNSDFLQRSIMFELQRSAESTPDSEWGSHQLEKYGGRAGWLGHHLAFAHLFLNGCMNKGLWESRTRVQHRLVHFELAMRVAAKITGQDPSKVAESLVQMGEGRAADVDWALEGLKVFADQVREKAPDKKFSSKDIAEWAQMHPDFEECDILVNSRKLGRYLTSHTTHIRRLVGINYVNRTNNRMTYEAIEPEIKMHEAED